MTTHAPETIAHIAENRGLIESRAHQVRERLLDIARFRSPLFSRPTEDQKRRAAKAFVAGECVGELDRALAEAQSPVDLTLALERWAARAECVLLALA